MTNLRFGFGIITLNAEEFIYQSIASVYEFADQIWVADGATPAGRAIANENGGSIDRTLEILHSFPDPEHKLHILPSRFYQDKNEQSNAYMEAMDANQPDYVWQLDSDELYHLEDLERVAQLIEEREAWHVTFRALHFWHNLKTVAWGSWWSSRRQVYHRVNKFQKGWRYSSHRPPTILVNGKPIWEVAPVITANELEREGIYLYHYSHVTERQVKQKMDWYLQDGSWSQGWYERVWKRWEKEPELVERQIGTHPVNLRNPHDPDGKGITRTFKRMHPSAMKTHPLWTRDYQNKEKTDTKTKVLHVIDHFSPGGGFVSPVQFVVRVNQEPGQEHHILILDSAQRDLVDIPPSGTIFENKHRSIADCARWISDADYEVVQWHWWRSMDLMNDLMTEMSKYGGHKRIITCDVYPAAPEFTLSNRELDYADMFIFDGKDSMFVYPQIPVSKKAYVVGGTALDAYTIPRTRRDDGKFRMGRGSVLSKWKCPPDLIQMVAPILAAVPNSEFRIFGDGELEPKLRADIKHLRLKGRVFLRGWVRNFEEEMVNLDMYLYHLPRNSFASSELNLQGAMAAGLPIVIMPSLGIRWMFEHGKDALVAENVVQAQEYCIHLAKDPGERARLGKNARTKAFKEFGIENMVRGYLEQIYPKCRMRFVLDGPVPGVSQTARGRPARYLGEFSKSARRLMGRAVRKLRQAARYKLKRLRIKGTRILLDLLTTPVIQVGRFLARLYTSSFSDLQLTWYDHIYDHLGGPENWHWLERGILASDHIRHGDRVLDLCCGDGTYSGIFFSPKAGLVDAVDINTDAIRVAQKRWSGRRNITFRVLDVLRDPFPHEQYEVVILNAALEYFSVEDGHRLLDKVSKLLSTGRGILFGCTPIWEGERSYGFGQRSLMTSIKELEEFLGKDFKDVVVWKSRDAGRPLYFFKCSQPAN
jgi:glycosyltransferase involved in cell wall biosynthesis/2-polyprenyl-3-methyl-5-hydroxy-6-metoxy-1,4-benzoquinol methylase